MSQTYNHNIGLWLSDMNRSPWLTVENDSKCSAGSWSSSGDRGNQISAQAPALNVPPQSSLLWQQFLPSSHKNVTTGKPECHCIWKPKIMRNKGV